MGYLLFSTLGVLSVAFLVTSTAEHLGVPSDKLSIIGVNIFFSVIGLVAAVGGVVGYLSENNSKKGG